MLFMMGLSLLFSVPAALSAVKLQASPRSRDLAPIRIGMSPAEVRKLVGPPTHVARQILYRRYLEQWIYDDDPATWIEFDCRRGSEPTVTGVRVGAGGN
jgi:hypothetical protein